jgi:hypothetical protein
VPLRRTSDGLVTPCAALQQAAEHTPPLRQSRVVVLGARRGSSRPGVSVPFVVAGASGISPSA